MPTPFPVPVQDPVHALPMMGFKHVYDFRQMTDNIIRNVANPEIGFGAEPVDFLNGGFEGTYSGSGGAPDWYKPPSSTGTYSKETNLPWESEGVAAQKITGNTDNNLNILSRAFAVTLARTYRVRFKIKVETGTCRIRIVYSGTPFTHYGWREFTSADVIGEHAFYFCPWRNTGVTVQIFNVGGASLTLTIDDMHIEPVLNDDHIFFNASSFSSDKWDGKSYAFSGLSGDQAANWNLDRNISFPNNKITTISKTDAVYESTQVSAVQTMYRSDILPGRTFLERQRNDPSYSDPRLEMYWSGDGTTAPLMKQHDASIMNGEIHTCIAFIDAPIADDDFVWDGEVIGHIAYSPQNTLFDPVSKEPYMIASFTNATSNFGSPFDGKIYLTALKPDLLTDPQKDFAYAITRLT